MNNIQPTIAIADDHRLMRDTLAAFLHNQGYNVIIQASNGQHLLDQLNHISTLPDLCLLDVDMPVMDGYETACYLRKHHASIKILATSVFYNEDKKEKMLCCGVNSFISKISNAEEWKQVLQELYLREY
ncbi:MAG: response regulator transcription factor [Chitinophagaceae bacterium]|nr:response regulator transcription factor [Chitinophagaceae bacterium]